MNAHDRCCYGTALAGGVSSDIRIVDDAQGRYVIKEALEKLKVAADWHCDPARSSIEVLGLRTIAGLLGQAHVPRVLWADETAHRFAMELIAPRFENWKQQLLRGNVDLDTARAAGRLLGLLHLRSSTSPDIAKAFSNIEPFSALRIEPFFERVAERNPGLAPAIAAAVDGMRHSRCALVHGDYSPKNLLVDSDDVVILDCEVAHWGDPRFDIAFCMSHLLLKSFRNEAPTEALCRAAITFLAAYREAGLPVLDDRLTQLIGCLLLARLEGDSPVNYLADLDTRVVKRYAIELLLHPLAHIEHHIGDQTRRPA